MVVRQSTQVPKTSKRRARSGVERVILMLAIVLDRRERGTGTLENMLCWVAMMMSMVQFGNNGIIIGNNRNGASLCWES